MAESSMVFTSSASGRVLIADWPAHNETVEARDEPTRCEEVPYYNIGDLDAGVQSGYPFNPDSQLKQWEKPRMLLRI
jgi:hypothetical protein